MPNGGKRPGAGRKRKIIPELEAHLEEQCEKLWLHAVKQRVADDLSKQLSQIAEPHRADLMDTPIDWRKTEHTVERIEELAAVLDEIRNQGLDRDVRTPKVGRQAIIKAVTNDFNALSRILGTDLKISPHSAERCWKAFRRQQKKND
jgi:phage host-nuclease inhibitor protein Gam